jgi:hypothetical protein
MNNQKYDLAGARVIISKTSRNDIPCRLGVMIDEITVNALDVVHALMSADNGVPNVSEDGIIEGNVHEDLLGIKHLSCVWGHRNIIAIEYVVGCVLAGTGLNTVIPGVPCLVAVKGG